VLGRESVVGVWCGSFGRGGGSVLVVICLAAALPSPNDFVLRRLFGSGRFSSVANMDAVGEPGAEGGWDAGSGRDIS
jgi:hypothetical protein